MLIFTQALAFRGRSGASSAQAPARSPFDSLFRRSLAPYIPINFVLKDMSSLVYKLRRISRPSPSNN